MVDEIDYYAGEMISCQKGSVELDGEYYVAEMLMTDDSIKLRIFDFNGEIRRDYIGMLSINKVTFISSFGNYLLFGLDLNENSFMRLGNDGVFKDYLYSAQGFLKSRGELSTDASFSSISVFGENLKKWSGCTRKLNRIIQRGIINQRPLENDCTEFEKSIRGLGDIGLYYSFRLGGLDGLHTVGMSVTPHVTITFDEEISLDNLIKSYVDLYMLLRFLIGESLNISQVKVDSDSCLGRNGAVFYLAEKKTEKNRGNVGVFIPYSTPYYDDSEEKFPSMVWDAYYNPDNNDTKELIKKYVTYTMVNSNEERFLGFYRIIETMTIKKSSYVDENRLSELLKRSRRFFAKNFPEASISDFFRAVKRANKSKHNTESSIHHFIKSFPQSMIDALNLDDVKIGDICSSRNKIIHQPLFSESPEKVYKFMKITEALTVLAIMSRLGISVEKIESIALSNGLQHTFRL
ncbi:HEPN domain-containing protein [Kosakonia sp. BYX6]|uniref:HEPN domain-containing protein n=1 Tax=Kosakonia calanthes TaxID=3139408 RepID=A0ABZ3BCI9_9ENTR